MGVHRRAPDFGEKVLSKLKPGGKRKAKQNTGSSVPGSGNSMFKDLEARGWGTANCSAGRERAYKSVAIELGGPCNKGPY